MSGVPCSYGITKVAGRWYPEEESDALEAVVAAVRPYAASQLHQDLVRALARLDALRGGDQ